jgi:serine phosphatase RsbU (regulator of sigma subunit)
MTRQVHELLKDSTGTLGHITSLNPIRPQNAPDEWEIKALKSFEMGKKEVSSIETKDGKEYMRLMRPLITEKSCLKCHEKQGYKLGNIRGGISAAVPMKPIWAVSEKRTLALVLGHTLLWGFGLFGLGMGTKNLLKSENARNSAEKKIREKNKQLKEINEVFMVQSDELKHAYVNLEKSKKIINDDLKLAQRLQREIFFSDFDSASNFNFFVEYSPLMDVSGDIYDIYKINDNHLRIFLADAPGHGTSAAFITILIKSEYEILKKEDSKLSGIMYKLNNGIINKYAKNNIIFPAIIVDIKDNQLTYCSAGLPISYLIKKGDEIISLTCKSRIIGASQNSKYNDHNVSFMKNDKLILFTDGIYEEFDENNEEFGLSRLKESLDQCKDNNVKDIIKKLIAKADTFIGDELRNDDITIIGVEKIG